MDSVQKDVKDMNEVSGYRTEKKIEEKEVKPTSEQENNGSR